ncbi:uncharacterized protein LOC128276653 [Anopheles cruzii]|uniref:uncharacterized protein LOC128276653 n=1 Tax=Anopheles cruzii TaxID=68878 RepID=UPI0022EC58F1|nr:uncharacterized protein LOC128276653 [Anopheles cruzii]
MSFGPRKPLGPARPIRPAVAKKSTVRPAVRSAQPKAQSSVTKAKAPPVTAPKKATSIAAAPAKPVAPKPPPTPEPPAADYESDFESDESVPEGIGSSSSGASGGESTDSDSSSSEASDEDGVDHREAEKDDKRPVVPAESTLPEGRKIDSIPRVIAKKVNPRTARSVDILSKISFNEVMIDLYQFDPEEYFELRTRFGITTSIAHGKHTQTDTGTTSTAQQTSRVPMRNRSTCMQGKRQAGDEEDVWDDGDDGDEDGVQNYSSLQGIERMFSTLSGALERPFSSAGSSIRKRVAERQHPTQQLGMLQLVRRAAPIFEALLERTQHRRSNPDQTANDDSLSFISANFDKRLSGSNKVLRTFDTGKTFEVRLLQNVDSCNGEKSENQMERFVIECWASGTYTRPTYRFSSWSSIVCLDYDCRRGMMVFGGTVDGTLQMWLGDAGRCYNEILPPHQIVAPDVDAKHKFGCWEMVTVKVLPVPVIRDSVLETGNDCMLEQVFALYSTGTVVVWHIQTLQRGVSAAPNALNAILGFKEITLVRSKVIDINTRLGRRVPDDPLRFFRNLILHDHYQMVVSSDRTVIRLSHFVDSDHDPAILLQPDPAHSIVTLKKMAHPSDTLFALYSNKTVHVLKLCTDPGCSVSDRSHDRKQETRPNLVFSMGTNKSCTIQSIVHDEAKRYGNTNSTTEGRADGGTIGRVGRPEPEDDGTVEAIPRPRFHHGQQILFFCSQHPEQLLNDETFKETTIMLQRLK